MQLETPKVKERAVGVESSAKPERAVVLEKPILRKRVIVSKEPNDAERAQFHEPTKVGKRAI